MTARWHRVAVTNTAGWVGDCTICGAGVPLRRRERRGKVEWSCMTKHREYTDGFATRAYRRLLGERCERCGFLPVHKAQLDGHHRDGNHENNEPANVATLCANCHRLAHIKVNA